MALIPRDAMSAGTLYIVATPIGNLEDITLRALRVLRESDLIACEDTRHTRKLLSRYEISTPLISYHEHNERQRSGELIEKLDAGSNIALVSDAGTPLISDPGFTLVRQAIEHGIDVVPVPGASALAAALAAAGLEADQFMFVGFLPSKRTARRAKLLELAQIPAVLIFYEAPHRITDSIRDALEVLGDRRAVIARELTKIHEEFIRGTLSELTEAGARLTERGEFVLLVAPPAPGAAAAVEGESLVAHVDRLVAEGLDRKQALKQAAHARGISKSEAYRIVLAEKRESEEERGSTNETPD